MAQTTGGGEPTEAAAEYLMTIRYMHGEGQPVIAARLAERLGVSAATVSEMVNRLAREGLLAVDPESRQLNLTDAGRVAAERTFRRHALSEWLLTEVIGLGWAEAEETIRPGRIVQHPTFGRGKVLKAEGYGESLMLEIMLQRQRWPVPATTGVCPLRP